MTQSFTAKDAEAAKEHNSLTAKAAKDAKEQIISTKGAKTTPSGNLDTDVEILDTKDLSPITRHRGGVLLGGEQGPQ